MSDLYLRSTDGDNATNGSTWALAKATIAGIAAIDSAGDRVFVSNVHAESTASNVTLVFAGLPQNPVQIICVNDSSEPPTTLASTATITTSGASSLTIQGCVSVYNVGFSCGAINLGSAAVSAQSYTNCTFTINNTGSSGFLSGLGGSYTASYTLKNCGFKFSGSSNYLQFAGATHIDGGYIISGSSSPTNIFVAGTNGRSGAMLIENFDFSNLSSSSNLFNASTSLGCSSSIIRNSKLPASWSGVLLNGSLAGPGPRFEMHNCDSSNTNYRLWIEDYAGSIKSETTYIKTGGASDGTVPFSWVMTANSNANYLAQLGSCELPPVWNTTLDTSVSITVDILTDSATSLTDKDIWVEINYLGTAGYPLGVGVEDSASDVLASPTNQSTSTATWYTTGMTNPNKQKLQVTFTPREVGYIQAKVICAKASTTVYIDPIIQVT